MNNYNVGIYIRLSKEDEIKNNENSESIINQKNMLLSYAKKNNLNVYDIYIDDGYSGTNFDRPDFKRLISDIELKLVNMILVKDLSRFGRDYVLTGYYLDFYFPKNNIRFVSLLDGIDSISNNSINDIVPFKSIINDMYSRDNSRKIKASLYIKQQQGKWVGGCPPFGYKVLADDKNHLVINEFEANIVKKIFSLFLHGKSINEIISYLYKNNILTPSIYRGNRKSNNSMWSSTTIKNILANQLYTGDMVQNRRNRISYKVKKLKKNPNDEWIIVPNTHDALVSKKDFELVSKLLKAKTRIVVNKKYDYLLNGLLYCYECGGRIVSLKNGKYFYLVCNNYKKYSKFKKCSSHYMNYKIIENKIIESLKYILSFVDIKNIKDKCNSILDKYNSSNKSKISNILNKIYIDKVLGNISEDTYNLIFNKYNNCHSNNSFDIVFNYNDKSFINMLIKKINICDDKSIYIYFNFKSLFIAMN